MDVDYTQKKYIKYKEKYLSLKNKIGGFADGKINFGDCL